MFRLLYRHFITRYPYLNPLHPIARREAHFAHPQPLPLTFRRLTNIWTLLGYAAMVHGVLFVVSVISYNRMNSFGGGGVVLPILSPFLTPFGTPLAAAFLSSLLYWAMLIGLIYHTTLTLSAELERGSWVFLRLTPYPTHEIVLAKLAAVARDWAGIVRTLLIVRLIAALILPISVVSQRTRETTLFTGLDLASFGVFMLQPFAEGAMVMGIAALSAVLIRQTFWARITALGGAALALGLTNGLMGAWLTFTSPMGSLGAMFIPLGHWTPLFAAVVPPKDGAMFLLQTVILVALVLLVPLIVAYSTMRLATKRLDVAL